MFVTWRCTSFHTHEWFSHTLFLGSTWLIHDDARHFTHVTIHDLCIGVTWNNHVCEMTCIVIIYRCNMIPSCVRHDLFIGATWLIHVCAMTTHELLIKTSVQVCVRHGSRICARPIHVCDTTRSYVWHDSFICVTWLVHVSDMTNVRLECVATRHCISLKSKRWCEFACAVSHSCVCHDSAPSCV